MTLAMLNVTFDCVDSATTARFWGRVFGWPATFEDMPGNPYWVVAGPVHQGPRLVFVAVTEAKATKNRVHLDHLPSHASQEEEVTLLMALGARVVDDRRRASPGGWVVLADPEGNEFCLEGGD